MALATAASAALLALSLPLGTTAASAAPAAPTAAAAASDPQTITVKVGAVRGSSSVGSLAGVTLELRTATNSNTDSPGAAVGTAWSTCVSDATGTCTFSVPNSGTGGANNGKQFWVTPVSAPTDYYLNPALVTGDGTNSGGNRFAVTPYAYRMPAMTGSGTITLPSQSGMPSNSSVGSPTTFSASTGERWKTNGILPVSQANNRYQATCQAGLKVAILFDLSTSMSSNNNEGMNGARAAGKAFVNSLVGTGARVALYTFGTNAPKNNSSSGQNYPTLTTVTSSSATTLNGYIDAYNASDINYTNWDRGLWQLAQSSNTFDIAVVLTDGNPTVYGANPSNPSSPVWTNFRHIEESIFSANALKDKGTQVLTFGVGDGISAVTGENLRSVSGTQEWTGTGSIVNFDYAKTDDWALVSSQLKALSAGLTCKVPITVTKTEQLLNGSTQLGQGWTFTASKTSGSGTLTGTAAQTTGSNGQASWSLDFSSPGDTGTVTIAETIKNSAWQLKSVVCTNNGNAFYSGTSLSFALPDLEKGDNIACAVTNQQVQASVKVDKNWVVNGTTYANGSQIPSSLAAQLSLGGSTQAWSTPKEGILVGGTTSIKETVTGKPSLCTVTSQRLDGPGATNVDLSGDKSFTTPALPAGLTTYTLTNTVDCTSELKLVKQVINDNGGTATAANWTLSYGQNSVASGTTSTVAPGTYALAESTVAGYQPRAVNPIVCSEGLSGTSVTVPIATTVTCTFYNDDVAPTLKLEKIVSGADGISPTNWTLSAKEGATTILSGNGSTAVTTVKANTDYVLSEAPNNFPAASDFEASAWSCQWNGQGQWVALASGALPKLALDDDVVCRITNSPIATSPQILKTVAPVVQNADGTWTVTYTVKVTNPSLYAGISYDLADTLAFGGTITKTATATGPSAQAASWNGVGNTVLADDVALAANSSHTYTVTAIASVPNGAPQSVTACPTDAGDGGFLNRAVLTVAGKDYADDACATPVKPSFTKSPGTVTSNPDGTWTLTYSLTATNSTGIPLYYDLVDDPQATLPSGVSIVSGSADGGSAWNPLSNTTVASDATLAANSSKVWTVSLTLAVAPSVSASTLDCTVSGSGIVNSATLTSGNQVLTGAACLSIPVPTIVHDKTVTSTKQNADGTWTIVYDVVVRNTGTVPGLYDLSDELHVAVPDTISVVSASAEGIPAWNGASNQTLATARLIAPGESNWQHYTITVVASVAEGATGTAPSRCAVDNGTNGFLNTATITVAGVDTDDSACSSPTRPNLTKVLVDSAPAGGNTWNVTYAITVDNSAAGARDAYYTLTDVPGFSSELGINSYTVTETSADPAATLPWNNGTIVGAPRALAGGSVDTFEVVVNVTVPAGVSSDVLECTVEKTPGHGFQNQAAIVVGTDTIESVDCGDITESAVPTIAKSIADGWPRQLADGTWEIVYDVTVTSDSELEAVYSLSDELGYGSGITVNSASIASTDATPQASWNGQTNTTVVTDQTLAGGAEHVYRVTVNASVSSDAYSSGSTACDPDQVEDGGFLNTVTLTTGQATPQTAADCGSPAQPTITKTVDPANPPALQADGSFLVTYLVTASNPSGTQVSYDLADTLGFPSGVTLSDPKATDPQGDVVADWDGTVDTALVKGALLAPGASDVYTITVTATVTDEFDLDAATCTGEPGNGFFNAATLVSGGIAQHAEDCAEIPLARLTLAKVVDNSAFEALDVPESELAVASDWVLSAEHGQESGIVGATGTADVTSVLVPAGSYELGEGVDLDVAKPLLDYYVAGEWDCTTEAVSGASLQLATGDDVTCTITNTATPVDLSIVKTDGGEVDGVPLVPTDEGGTYEYTFVVTNQGTIAATNAVVADEIPGTLKVDLASVTKPAGWSVSLTDADADSFGGTLVFTADETFPVGAVATFTFDVTTASALPRTPENPTGAILDIVNTATVDSDGVEATPEDNTSTEETPVKSIVTAIESSCLKDAAYADWSVTPTNTETVGDTPVVLIWWTEDAYLARDRSIPASDTAAILADGASWVDTLPAPAEGWKSGVTVTGTQLWPGTEVNADGQGIAWPGWTKQSDGAWKLDPAAPFYDIHEHAIVEVRMNPATGSAEAYPPATPECSALPPFEPPTLPEPPDKPTPPTPPTTPIPPAAIPLLASTGLNLVAGLAVGAALLATGALTRRRKAH
ncbi:putative repeat protein (TIGR01451 family) [Leifsonia sp. AK011]|uniref:prealbumin-like fold domain-containing protein n=1 Tax=Leifsonia sp. AK011 TaxID=2723075 RepID=UPI0015CEC479|nr:DUF11 domain-containing protein [Leifsonia sp. AK011]NYF11612.1 putative repeat protein (TIGR01451 family) [Leifsonia sp. AK011]